MKRIDGTDLGISIGMGFVLGLFTLAIGCIILCTTESALLCLIAWAIAVSAGSHKFRGIAETATLTLIATVVGSIWFLGMFRGEYFEMHAQLALPALIFMGGIYLLCLAGKIIAPLLSKFFWSFIERIAKPFDESTGPAQ